jgi:hypothetical protein
MGYPITKEVDAVLVTFMGITGTNPLNPIPPNQTFQCNRINALAFQYLSDVHEVTYLFNADIPRLWYADLIHRFVGLALEPFYSHIGYWNSTDPFSFKNSHEEPELPYHSGFGSVTPLNGYVSADSAQTIASNLALPIKKGTFLEQFAPIEKKRQLRFAVVGDHTCIYITPK